MANMKQKKRKRRNRQWAEFQQEFELSDEDLALLRSTGYALAKIRERLSDDAEFDQSLTLSTRIRQLHAKWRDKLAKRRAAIEAGEIQPKPKKKKKTKHDPAWAKAKKVCRLNMEDIRMAKELGMSPRSLLKNVPSPSQQWKAPVKEWIRELYEKRQAKKMARKAAKRKSETQSTDVPEQVHEVDPENCPF